MSASQPSVSLSPAKRRRITVSTSESSVSEISSIHSTTSSLLHVDLDNRMSFDGTSCLKELERPKAMGFKSELIKPTAKKGLYVKMIKNYSDIENIIGSLIGRIEDNFNNAFKILQIIPDLLLIDFNITSYTVADYGETIGEVFLQAATRQIDLQDQKCIFNLNTRYANDLSTIIDYFLWHLCQKLTANEEIIPLAHQIFKVFTCFLRQIAKSSRYVLRLVAYTFAFRINKFLCIRRIQLSVNENDESASALFIACYNIMEKHNIDNIYDSEGRNLSFKCFYMEYTSIMHVCFVAAPALFANDKNFNMIISLLSSGMQSLSTAAMNLCMKLVKHNELIPVLSGDEFSLIIDMIEDLISSPHHKEQILAANFFTSGLKKGAEFAKRMTVIKALVSHCYYPNLIVAEACGEAIAVFLSQHAYITAYKMLYNFATGFEQNTFGSSSVVKYSYLVEALHNHYEQLGWLYLILALTTETDLTVEEYQMVAEILYHVTYVKLKGFTEYEREGRKVCPNTDPVAHGQFVQKVLENIKKIITVSQYDATSIEWVIKSIDLVEDQCRVLSLTDVTENALQQFIELIRDQEKREDLWSSCIHLFKTIMNVREPSQLSIRMRTICEGLFNNYIAEYDQNMATMEEAILNNWNTDVKNVLIKNLIKIKIMLKHDVCEQANLETFLDRRWNELPEEVFIEQINCTIECIRMHLEKLTTESDVSFVRDINDKAMKVWTFMNDAFSHFPDLQVQLYLAMGILIYNYKINILRLPNLSFDYYNNWDTENVMNFLYQKCFSGVEDGTPLATKRLYVSHSFTLFDVPTNLFRSTLDFICSQHHKEFERYGCVYETYWNLVRGHSQVVYFNKIINVLSLEEEETHPYWEVLRLTNFDELLNIYLDLMSPSDKNKFFNYMEDYNESKPSRVLERHIKALKAVLKIKSSGGSGNRTNESRPTSAFSRSGSVASRAPSVASNQSSAASTTASRTSRPASASSGPMPSAAKAKPGPSKPSSG